MAKVLFRVSYSIPDGKRADYLAAVAKLTAYYAGVGQEYSVFETRGKHNHFQEVYVYPSVEAYEASDDPETIADISGAIEKIYGLATNVTYDVAEAIG